MGIPAKSFKVVLSARRASKLIGDAQRRRLAMAAALLLPLLMGESRSALAPVVWPVLAGVSGMVGGVVLWGGACQRRRGGSEAIPMGQGVRPTDTDGPKRLPLVTLSFIAASILLSLTLPDAAAERLCRLRFDDSGLWDLIRVTAARTVLQDGHGRLFVNAVLLGFVGVYLEPRLGALRVLGLLIMGSFVSGLIGLNLMLPHIMLPAGSPYLLCFPPAGGAGATAALLGFGALGWHPGRDGGQAFVGGAIGFYKTMDILWPLLIALVFWGPLSGHTMPLTGQDGMAGYWGQAGGFVAGLAMALLQTRGENDICGTVGVAVRSASPAAECARRDDGLRCGGRLSAHVA